MLQYFTQAFEELFPDYKPNEDYDFSSVTLSKADAQRYQQVGDSMERSFKDNKTIEISNDTYHFI